MVEEGSTRVITQVRILKETLTEQYTYFMSHMLRELYESLGIKSIRTNVFHLQTDGMVEWFIQTLNMIHKFVHDDTQIWDKGLKSHLVFIRH